MPSQVALPAQVPTDSPQSVPCPTMRGETASLVCRPSARKAGFARLVARQKDDQVFLTLRRLEKENANALPLFGAPCKPTASAQKDRRVSSVKRGSQAVR